MEGSGDACVACCEKASVLLVASQPARHHPRGSLATVCKKLGKQLTHKLSPPARAQRPLVVQCPLLTPLEHVDALCEPP